MTTNEKPQLAGWGSIKHGAGRSIPVKNIQQFDSAVNTRNGRVPVTSNQLDEMQAADINLPSDAQAKAGPAEDGLADSHDRTEIHLAQRVADANLERLRWAPGVGWLAWDGRRWAVDDDSAKRVVTDFLCGVADELRGQLPGSAEGKGLGREIIRIESAKTVASVAEQARIDARLKVDPAQLDSDPMLLNLLNGTIDLRTGQFREHRPADLLTKLAGAGHDPDAACPTWLAFLDRVMGGDSELIGYVQRAVGYMLTGSTSEQCLFLLLGVGRNGKTTLAETLLALLGDYGAKVRAEVLLLSNRDGVPNEIAALRGARLVVASEMPSGRRLNESLVKDLTGGDTITARLLYREAFSFRPAFKLLTYGNHRPEITGADDGIWRRIRLLPFEVQIPESEVDPHLPERLRGELPGILNWALAGLRAWQERRLGLSGVVAQATAAYRVDQDVVRQFVVERCETGTGKVAETAQLYRAFMAWSGNQGVGERKFGSELDRLGYPTVKSNGRRVRREIGLLDV